MFKSEPFKRAKAMAADIAAIMQKAAGDLAMRKMLLDALPTYESRGHGKRARKMCKTNFLRGAYNPPIARTGKRETERRLRQAERLEAKRRA
jgi:hypothetical protein